MAEVRFAARIAHLCLRGLRGRREGSFMVVVTGAIWSFSFLPGFVWNARGFAAGIAGEERDNRGVGMGDHDVVFGCVDGGVSWWWGTRSRCCR
jgi:hypothetical protein